MNELIIKVAKKNEVTNYKGIRSVMDKSLNTMLDNTDIKIFYEVFEKDYDGRKISLKYFIDLCIRFLEKQRYYCLDKKPSNQYDCQAQIPKGVLFFKT